MPEVITLQLFLTAMSPLSSQGIYRTSTFNQFQQYLLSTCYGLDPQNGTLDVMLKERKDGYDDVRLALRHLF